MVLDALGRSLHALRISVTDRCNFRCPYCMPRERFGPDYPFLPETEILGFEETRRLAGIFVGLGVDKVRLTGGEPLLRRGLPDLVAELKTLAGLREIVLTTNGALLAELALPLREAGLDRVTVSLDSLDPARFRALSGTGVPLEHVLEGLEAATCAGFRRIKLNCVLRRGVAEEEILALAAFARERGHLLRFIEFMDVGGAPDWTPGDVLEAAEVAEILGRRWPLERTNWGTGHCVAQHWRYLDGRGDVGLIASVTEPFCRGCDRGRLSADGHFYTCLFASSGLDLKAPLREGASDAELARLVAARWALREDRYSELRSERAGAGAKVAMHRMGG